MESRVLSVGGASLPCSRYKYGVEQRHADCVGFDRVLVEFEMSRLF